MSGSHSSEHEEAGHESQPAQPETSWQRGLRAEIQRQAPQLTFHQQTELLAEIEQEVERGAANRPVRPKNEVLWEYVVGKALARHISDATKPLPAEWLAVKRTNEDAARADILRELQEGPERTAQQILDRIESELPTLEKRVERLMYHYGL